MRLNFRRYLLWGVLGAALVGGLAYTFWPRPTPVDLASVVSGPLSVTIDEYGQTRIRDLYLVSAPVAGELSRIKLESGDPVAAGITVVGFIQPAEPALLDARSYQERSAAAEAAAAAVTLAETEITRTQVEMEFAAADLARARSLNLGATISPRDLQIAETAFKTREAANQAALASLAMRRFELERARVGLAGPESNVEVLTCCVQIVAPVGGRVLRVLRNSSGLVGGGEPLIEIGDPDALEVVVDLLTTDAVLVSEGAEVAIVGWGEDQSLTGRVRRVEPYGFTKVSALGIEEQRVNVRIDFESPSEAWRQLGHAFRIEARIVVWSADAAVKAPLSAIFRSGDDWATFVDVDGRAELRLIQVGHRSDEEVEVLSGLQPGDRVIVRPSSDLRDGLSIQERVAETGR